MRKQHIDRHSSARVMLTDTLPYETPFFFSNERLFHAASTNPPFKELPEIARHLLDHDKVSRPLSYSVHKGGGTTRKLAVPHPASQLRFSDFYREFDGFIENLCARSSYSLRYPSRVGSHYFQANFEHQSDLAGPHDFDPDPTSFYSQRKWASNYFHYRQYPQMYRFFGSEEFTRLEQQYCTLLQLDISKCFDSIYTHSLSWAVRGKEFSKNTIESSSFESRFDQLMRNANWAETNGILVGPEVSRIFAEVILQAIDRNVERLVTSANLDVVVKRYIDDYMIFGNSERDVTDCKDFIEIEIGTYNLHLNKSKTVLTTRPLVSLLSGARDDVHQELSTFFALAKDSLKVGGPSANFPRDASDRVIRSIRRIAKHYGVGYDVLASPALAVIVRNLHRLKRRCGSTSANNAPPKHARAVISETVKITHFLFNMDIRVATSHKVARIYFEACSLARLLGADNKALENQIIDGMRTALQRAKELKISGPEIVNILVAVEAVCRNKKSVRLADLEISLGVKSDWTSATTDMNYFDLVSALYFSRRKQEFVQARNAVTAEIENRIIAAGKNLHARTAETMLFFDALSCPHIDISVKNRILKSVNDAITGNSITTATANTHVKKFEKTLGFIAWDGAKHFSSLLERKELQPAYD